MRTFLIASALCAGTILTGWTREWQRETVDHLNTKQGLIQIDSVGADGYEIRVGGRLVADLTGFFVRISNAVPSGDSPQYVLLKISTGGGSCPVRYRLLDLTPGQKATVTREFGNCGSETGMTMEGDHVTIHFEKTRQFKPHDYLYDAHRRQLRTFYW